MTLLKNNIMPAVILILFTLPGCGLDSNLDEESASAIIEAFFIDSENGFPITDTNVLVSVVFKDEDRVEDQGTVATDANGSLEVIISNSVETVITRLIFTVEIEEDTAITVEENVDLELRITEPLDSVSLIFEI